MAVDCVAYNPSKGQAIIIGANRAGGYDGFIYFTPTGRYLINGDLLDLFLTRFGVTTSEPTAFIVSLDDFDAVLRQHRSEEPLWFDDGSEQEFDILEYIPELRDPKFLRELA